METKSPQSNLHESTHDAENVTSSQASRHDDASQQAGRSSYAFLVHSSDSMTNNLPPDVDNKPLARQKRRRTSPEDQAVLETEYQRNSKPDKAARMDIVTRVALGEKEVQIWFQNRRQSSRRKSRPLLPHEIAQYQTSASRALDWNGTPLPRDPLQLTQPDRSNAVAGDHDASPDEQDNERGFAKDEAAIQESRQGHIQGGDDTLDPQTQPSSQDTVAPRLGYLANRRSSALVRPEHGDGDVASSPEISFAASQGSSAKGLRKSSSFVRLSMTADGAAKIVTKESSSPSPPRKAPSVPDSSSAPTSFRTSFGTVGGKDEASPAPSQGSVSLKRRPSGRSRDSRAWEFWCDKDARSVLEERADQEASGSAADAIGLLRSSSGRGILQSLPLKRHHAGGAQPALKRSKSDKTPLLQRSHSLQNRMPRATPDADKPRKFAKAASGLGIELAATDSDKENWSPERHIAHDERHVEEVNRAAASNRKHRHGTAAGRQSAKISVHLDDPEDDEEVSNFMSGDRASKSNSVSEEEELDCVQGLLSLSQGNWK